ncbi:MAG: PD-(D/E)XK nuclease family protein [Candidatus Thalassarchaeaceae archaeon]
MEERGVDWGPSNGYEIQEYQLSPSSWNRFEECPRKYWLSRQGLPKKIGMPIVIGNAVHNSVEDICNIDMSDRDISEKEWLPKLSAEILSNHWQLQKDIFFEMKRHSGWKKNSYNKAREGLNKALLMLLSQAKILEVDLSKITIGMWNKVREIILANEGTMNSKCGKLMGRLDLLLKDLDQGGNQIGWIVVDLKTGRPPKDNLSETVNRQLRFYRDLLILINPNHPPIRTEGWYTSNQTMYEAIGDSVTKDAFDAWASIELTEDPFQATPQEFVCGFCEWKAWCPKWFVAVHDETLKRHKTFNDEVVTLINFDSEEGLASFKLMIPDGLDGELRDSEKSFGAFLSNQSLNQLRELQNMGYDGPLFLGSTRVDGEVRYLGDWSEILPWNPLLKSIRQ